MIRPAFDAEAKAVPSKTPLPPLFTSTNVDKRYLPGRAILWSILVHSLVICGLLSISVSADFAGLKRPPLRVTMVNLKDPNYRLYLPVLMGADPPPASQPDRGSVSVETKPNGTSDDRMSRLSYPGPQPIVSDFPNPTNHIQTILQPALIQPPVLPPPLMLPNVVRAPVVPPGILQPKLARALEPPDLPAPRFPTPPELKSSELPVIATASPIDLSKIALPVNTAETIPEMAPPQTDKLETKVASAPLITSATNPPNVPDVVAKRVEPLLVLSPMPSPPDDTVKVPVGEARGRFSISPDPNLTGSEKEDTARPDHTASGTGIRTANEAAKASPDNGGTAAKTVPVQDKDAPSTNSAANPTRTEKQPATASASGTDDRRSRNAFPGITILESGAGANPTSKTGAPAPLQTSYGVTIVSTESSGGGLPEFGVFSNEQVFTVFVDMRRTITDVAPSWTFEYSLLKPATAYTNIIDLSKRNQQGAVLPFPTVKEQPALPVELARKYIRGRIIVYAVINVEGKMDQMVVKESPDPGLNEPVLRALTKWSFRPAQVDGENVPAKALMGIPIFLAQ